MRHLLWIVLGLCLLARLAPLDHGLPFRYVPDTHMVRGALGMAASQSLAPSAGTYTSYPYLMPYLLLPAFVATYAVGRVTGTYEDAADFRGAIIDDPTPVYLLSRGLVALFGILSIYLAYRVGRRSMGKKEGCIAAFLVATSLLLVHLSLSARPWVPLVALVLLTAERSLAFNRRPTRSRAIQMGIAAGLAAACHQTGALAVLLPAGAVLGTLSRGLGASTRSALLAAVCFVPTALLIGYPYFLTGSSADAGVESDVSGDSTVSLGGQSFVTEAFGTERTGEVMLSLVSAEPVLFLLFLLGLPAGLVLLRKRSCHWTVCLYPAALLAIFIFYAGTHVRYLSPALPFLALFSAAAVVRMWRSPVLRIVAIVMLACPLATVLRLAWILTEEDTRTTMLAEVSREVPAGEVIVVEAYGPMLRFSADAVKFLQQEGKWASNQEEREAAGLTPEDDLRPPYTVVPLERFYKFASVWPHQWLDPDGSEKPVETFIDEVGARYLIAVDRFPGGPRNSALDEVLARRGEVLARELPYNDQAPLASKLPMDPDRGVLDIFSVNRPGPALTLYRIGPAR